MKLTPAQKKLEREYKRMQSIIESASKGQQFIRPINGTYSEAQHATYKQYQGYIDRARQQMSELEAMVHETSPR